MGFSDSLLNPINLFEREDPTKGANRFLNKIPAVGEKYYNPYIDRGRQAESMLQGQYKSLLRPTSFIDDIMKNYSLSKGAQYQRSELGKGIGATAAAGGIAGTPEHQKEYGEMADKIMSGDMQQYLQNALNVYGMGLGGEKEFYGKGYDAAKELAEMIANKFASQSGLAFQGASQTNASRDSFLNSIVKAISTAFGASS